jgi:hypothetical protein
MLLSLRVRRTILPPLAWVCRFWRVFSWSCCRIAGAVGRLPPSRYHPQCLGPSSRSIIASPPLNPRRKIAKRTGERTDSGKPCMGSACSTILLASTSSRPSAPGPGGSMAPGIDVRKQRESCHGEGATSWWLFLWVLRCGGKRFVTKLRFCGTERKGLGTNHDKRDFAGGQQHSSFTLLHPWTALPHRSIEFRLIRPS